LHPSAHPQRHYRAEKEGAFPTTAIRVKPNTTPATTDKDIAEKIVNDQKDLKELFTEPSYEEMTEVLGKWLDPSAEADAQGTKPATKPITGEFAVVGSQYMDAAGNFWVYTV